MQTIVTVNSENSEKWFVRVQDRDYGPVGAETLRDWQAEGRLLPTNQVRRQGNEQWMEAARIPGLFAPPPLPAVTVARARPRHVAELLGEAIRLYRRAFPALFLSSLLVAVPMLAINLTSSIYGLFPSNRSSLNPANVTGVLAFVWLVVAWPIFVASMQLAAGDLRDHRPVHLATLWRRAVNFFPRIALLSLVVYGSYFFWVALPFLAMASVAGAGLMGVLLALALFAVQLVMLWRFFVNFLFWQQAAVLSGRDGPFALRESRMLARSKRSARPLARAIGLALIWFFAFLSISVMSQLPWALPHFGQFTTPAQAFDFLQKLNTSSPHPEPLLVGGAVASSLMQALLRPVFALAFFLLYEETRADFTEEEIDRAVDSEAH